MARLPARNDLSLYATPPMRWIIALLAFSLLLLAFGLGLIVRAIKLPVYTDPAAPDRLASQLVGLPDPETRTRTWYEQLQKYETPHKKLFDLGYGIAGLGIGLLFSFRALFGFLRSAHPKPYLYFYRIWVFAWILTIFGDSWYYPIHQHRYDYPPWSDSIAIPIFSGRILAVMGCLITALLLAGLMVGREWPTVLRYVRPNGLLGWLRMGILMIWQFLLGYIVFDGVYGGDPGSVVACTLGLALLLLLMAAPLKQKIPPEIP